MTRCLTLSFGLGQVIVVNPLRVNGWQLGLLVQGGGTAFGR
jgi:hypothetical protein